MIAAARIHIGFPNRCSCIPAVGCSMYSVAVVCRQEQVEGGERATARCARVSTMSGQGPDAVPAVPSPRRLPTLRRRHGRLHQVWPENTRHRPHIYSLTNTVEEQCPIEQQSFALVEKSTPKTLRSTIKRCSTDRPHRKRQTTATIRFRFRYDSATTGFPSDDRWKITDVSFSS